MPKGRVVTKIISDLKSYTWGNQAPAIKAIFELDWSALTPDEIFVLGRNIYQCADGGENHAKAILVNLRRELAKLPEDAALHLLNGMFFEVYFNAKGELRPHQKGPYLGELFELEQVKKFAPSISYIHRALQPYQAQVPFIPSLTPEPVRFKLVVTKSLPLLIKSLKLDSRELLMKVDETDDFLNWGRERTYFRTYFTLASLKRNLARAGSIPLTRIEIVCSSELDASAELRLPKGRDIRWPRP
jgi:hypothetical protein